ncbi:MAG: ABC transporter substrate-binding protein [Antarcticimicrobium sp.]|uniref:ABC transporter substrate-binding protein n=1 Tax=Antarcticimicrobium sp. TaxID=2824147 RepID=UPI0026341019|nr:ABC transporter substrate-binding protein [Antarcticimicrobium sp.]MDF1716142.1 ABC transporter substrate-binding protein [Antarcticimicrobium sp.]
MRPSRIIPLLAALVLTGAAAVAEAPQRVVSVNLCTDQLALLLAAPGQIVSLSRLSQDAESSSMAEAARAYPTNGSGAEEVYLLNPDLVLAGTFTAPTTVQMLRDLGIRVELFAPARSLADVPDRIAQMGAVLGHEAEAEAMIGAFRAELARLSTAPDRRPRAALYYVNSYTLGDRTLAGDILRAAGFDNVAAEAGLEQGGTLALEHLILLAPEVIVSGRDYPGQARAEEVLSHPALRALPGTRVAGTLTDRDWICGTPLVLAAVEKMRALRLSLETGE